MTLARTLEFAGFSRFGKAWSFVVPGRVLFNLPIVKLFTARFMYPVRYEVRLVVGFTNKFLADDTDRFHGKRTKPSFQADMIISHKVKA